MRLTWKKILYNSGTFPYQMKLGIQWNSLGFPRKIQALPRKSQLHSVRVPCHFPFIIQGIPGSSLLHLARDGADLLGKCQCPLSVDVGQCVHAAANQNLLLFIKQRRRRSSNRTFHFLCVMTAANNCCNYC